MHKLTIFPTITREHRSLERYLSELNKIPLIDAEEEIRLAGRIRAGDRAALEQLVRANLRFVVSVAKQYQHPCLSLMDLRSIMTMATKLDLRAFLYETVPAGRNK